MACNTQACVFDVNGGYLETLSFAITGDTRPPNSDDTAGYPTAIINTIWQDIQNFSPRPAFALTTGEYMDASPTGTQAAPQMSLYLTARAKFSNPVFYTLSNFECDGNVADNCGTPCTSSTGSCPTPNYSSFMNSMIAAINQTLPYYSFTVKSNTGAWTTKFIVVACNAWSTTQSNWFNATLAVPTTYTFVVSHYPTSVTTAPCMAASPSVPTIMSRYPYNLFITGHTNTYAYYASQKQVVVGNGGAPLSGSVNYGYAIITLLPSGQFQLDEYDYSTNARQQTATFA